MQGKITLVTGANSGLGQATAAGLAKLGAAVVMVCRSRERGEDAQREIMAASSTSTVELMVADLSSQQSIRQLVDAFKAKYDRLHVLVNNVGVSYGERRETVDSIEYNLAVNHLAPFLLTNLLLDVLKTSAPARIVNVGTRLNAAMDFDDLQYRTRPYRPFKVYGESKLGNLHFTYELARRLAGSGVTVNCVHPGIFKSNLGKGDGPESLFWRLLGTLGRVVLADADKAARRVLYLAASTEVEGISGKYFADRKAIQSPEQTYDRVANERLWELSAQLTGLIVSSAGAR